MWTEVLEALEHRVSRDQLRFAWSLAFDPNTEVLAMIDAVDRDHALLTNNGPILGACLDVELQAVRDRFQSCILSCHLGCTKPDPDVFRRADAMLGVPPEQLLLIDDQPANAAAAQNAGWRSVLYADEQISAAGLRKVIERTA